jgi:hypothetical protein
VLGTQVDYVALESLVQSSQPVGGQLDRGAEGAHTWWDQEACARQLPYHRILVAAENGHDPYGGDATSLHKKPWCAARLPDCRWYS